MTDEKPCLEKCMSFCDTRLNLTEFDILEVAVVEDNLPINESEDPSMPPKLNMTISLLQNDTNNVDLKLGMNRALNEQRSVYVLRTNKAGQPVLRKQQIPIEGNIAFYQDKDTGANVMMTCDGFEVGHCDPVLEGSFYVKDVEYGLEPLTEDSPLRRKRSVNGRRGGRLYSVFRRNKTSQSKTISILEYTFQQKVVGIVIELRRKCVDDMRLYGLYLGTDSVNNGANAQSMQLVDRVLDLSEFMNPASATMEMRRRTSDTDEKKRQRKKWKRRKNLSSTPYQMGLIVIIDFSIYQTWYRRSDKTTPAERDIDAKSKIRQYMAHVINGVDLRFQNLRSNRIKIVVSRYIIADTQGASPWTTRRFLAQPRDLVYADDVLNELIKWRYRMGHELPRHDHTILFTGYDLYRPTLANKGVAGFARVRSMCSHSSVSVVEEHGGFGSVLTATHEIGHSLGAYHDGHNNTCAGEDNFIMTPIGGSATPSNALNPFHFSECSEDAFNHLIEALPPNNCLTDETDIYDQEEFDSHVTQKAGQLYGPNEQCRQHLGSESYYAWGGILGEATEVCTHMACKNAMSNTSFNIYYAAQGTSCGNKQWCVDGECLREETAPKRDDSCVHGDAWRDFSGLTCAQYVNADPSRCYYSYYSRFCCVSCKSLRTGDPGCEYGNRKKKVCRMVEKDPRFCYHDNNENLCCETCKKHNTGITGCEYGDRLPNCTIERCADETYHKKCCKTCRQFKPKPVLVGPVSPLRESILPAISMSPKINSSTDETSTSGPIKVDASSPFNTKSTLTLPKPIPNSQTTQQQKDQKNTFATTHKIEGIKVSELGPITPLQQQGHSFANPLVTKPKASGFLTTGIGNQDKQSDQTRQY
ncbi:uncharacterized protein LOC117335902 [Pecten maximus]|uniref:uncharacterized protein LOC117335902 n=1 Tax=Pecten maximus TaxID=6579 RepID=UPI001458E430|nr:uncharacterized protein LOC117335902 [Pecten maximus]